MFKTKQNTGPYARYWHAFLWLHQLTGHDYWTIIFEAGNFLESCSCIRSRDGTLLTPVSEWNQSRCKSELPSLTKYPERKGMEKDKYLYWCLSSKKGRQTIFSFHWHVRMQRILVWIPKKAACDMELSATAKLMFKLRWIPWEACIVWRDCVTAKM